MHELRRSRTVQALIDLEDAGDPILSERLPGSPIPFWTQVRMEFAGLLGEQELGDATIAVQVPLVSVLRRFARALLPSPLDLANWGEQRDIAFVVGGTTQHVRDGMARNWLVDGYARTHPDDTLVVQRSALPSGLGLPAFTPTRSLDPAFARGEVRLALRRGREASSDGPARELVAAFARRLGVTDHPRLAALSDSAAWNERLRPHIAREFNHFLDRVRPRLLLIEDASYGGLLASLVALARSRGLLVAEPQHGWIGPGHNAYNYGRTMFTSENSVGLPDVLLTFGEQWGKGLSFPGDIVPIGKPHLEEYVANASEVSERPAEVLVVSSISRAPATLAFLNELRKALPEAWAVRFRPHPGERSVLDSRYPGIREMQGVIVDERPDVLDSLAACRIVVGVASTVLFEAAALGCRVFVRDSPYVPIVMGDMFGRPLVDRDAAARIARVALDPGSSMDGASRVELTKLWRPGAIDNFFRWADASLRHS